MRKICNLVGAVAFIIAYGVVGSMEIERITFQTGTTIITICICVMILLTGLMHIRKEDKLLEIEIAFEKAWSLPDGRITGDYVGAKTVNGRTYYLFKDGSNYFYQTKEAVAAAKKKREQIRMRKES